jgi:sulfopyruvate decarboxylase subunit beta
MTTSDINVADQYRCTELLLETTPDAAVISNLGASSYILMDIDDREKNFYMTGAMGVTSPIGLGLAMSIDAPVTVIEGDGSLLMSLGCLTTISEQDPSNLAIVVMNNGSFETTGRQRSLADTTDFAAVARDCGLAAWNVSSTDEFTDAYAAAVDHDGTGFVSVAIEPFTPEEYPTLDYAHSHVKHRFRTALAEDQ